MGIIFFNTVAHILDLWAFSQMDQWNLLDGPSGVPAYKHSLHRRLWLWNCLTSLLRKEPLVKENVLFCSKRLNFSPNSHLILWKKAEWNSHWVPLMLPSLLSLKMLFQWLSSQHLEFSMNEWPAWLDELIRQIICVFDCEGNTEHLSDCGCRSRSGSDKTKCDWTRQALVWPPYYQQIINQNNQLQTLKA